MSADGNGANGVSASVIELVRQNPEDPTVQVLSEIVKELRSLREEVNALRVNQKRNYQYVRDDLKEMKEKIRLVPAMKQMLAELASRK
jgi:hypothetical protein